MLRKRSKKTIAILALLALVMTMLPISTALASSVEVLSRPVVNDDTVVSLGTVFEESTAGQIKDGDTATIRLPEGFEFRDTDGTIMTSADWKTSVVGSTYRVGNNDNYFEFPEYYLDNKNGLVDGQCEWTVTQLDDNEIRIKNVGTPTAGLNNYFYLHLGRVYVDSGFDGDINLVIDAPSNSGFMPGTAVVGRATGGAVDMEVTNVPTFSDNAGEDGYLKIRVKEDAPDALDDKSETLKWVLPNGFEFKSVQGVDVLWGVAKDENGNELTGDTLANYLDNYLNIDQDELTLDLPSGFTTTEAISFEITVDYYVEDETQAELGDVVARVQGKSDISVSEMVVGHYGQYESTIEAGDAPTVVAGMLEQSVAKVSIKESIAGSLIDGRTITMTLPSNAKWGDMDEDTDNGVSLEFVGFPGKDGQTAKWEVKGESSDAATLELDDLEVVLEPGYEGDLTVQVAGTAGLTGDLVLAKEVKAVQIKAESKPVIGIGQGSQQVGDLTITEAIAGAITDDADLYLELPEGVRWVAFPKVEVTEGDLDIDFGGITTKSDNTDDNILVVPIDGKSSVASTIKVSDIKIDLTRNVPQGDVWVKVKGTAVGEVNNWKEVEDYFNGAEKDKYVKIFGEEAFDLDSDGKIFPETATASKTFFATVGTPAPGESAAEAKFVIGETKYTVNGQEQAMDIAAYLKNGRTYLPIRYVGLALGVDENNILWDGKNATLIKGNKVVQVTPGSKIMKVNGADIIMDVPCELTSGRNMLPFRWIAQAFGAQVSWDEATQTVTMTL